MKFTTAGDYMRTQPQEIIERLEADNSKLAKQAILLEAMQEGLNEFFEGCLLYTSPSPRDLSTSRMPSSA